MSFQSCLHYYVYKTFFQIDFLYTETTLWIASNKKVLSRSQDFNLILYVGNGLLKCYIPFLQQ